MLKYINQKISYHKHLSIVFFEKFFLAKSQEQRSNVDRHSVEEREKNSRKLVLFDEEILEDSLEKK